MELLTIQAYHWQSIDYNTPNDNVNIYVWALDKNNNPYLLRILNFPHSCYIELPSYVNNKYKQWNELMGNMIGAFLSKKYENYKPINYTYIDYRKKLYYAQEKTSHMLHMTFKNKKDMDTFVKQLNYPIYINNSSYQFKVWETEFSIVRKLLSLVNIKMSQWFNVDGIKVKPNDKISVLENEYYIDFKTMKPIDDTISKDWKTYPGILIIDGEMYAQNKKALPDPLNSTDICYMISCIYQRYDKPDTRKRYIILIGDCPDIENVNVIRCKNEIELGDKFADLIMELDPEIVSGYNILAFDYPYIYKRRERTGIEWKQMGRLYNHVPYLYNKPMKSKGAGNNSINFLVKEGRIDIDFMNIAKRELKLNKYGLNDVAKALLKETKHDISAEDMFKIYENMILHSKAKDYCDNNVVDLSIKEEAYKNYNLSMLEYKKVAEYCVQDSELVIKLFDTWKAWIYLVELSKIQSVNMQDLFTAGQQIRVVNQIYDYASNNNFIIDKKILPIVNWVGGFVFDPCPGLYEYVICLDFKSLYPSIIRAFNLCYTTLVPEDQICNYNPNEYEIFEWDEEIEIEESNTDPVLIDTTTRKKKIVKKENIHLKYYFLKKTKTLGLLPTLVGRLIDGRNEVKKEQSGIGKLITILEEKDKDLGLLTDEKIQLLKYKAYHSVLGKRELGLKLTANSYFGSLGVQEGGMLPLIEVARVITAMGKKLILKCNDFVTTKYNAKVIYNDTDSTMFTLPFVTNGKECIEWGHIIEKELSSQFPPPLYTEFEKAGRMFAMAKKKYAFWQYHMFDNPKLGYITGDLQNIDKGLLVKGMLLARRDNCEVQRDITKKVLYNILNKNSIQSTIDIIIEKLINIYTGNLHYTDYIIIKTINAHYKSDSANMKIFGDELIKIGKPPTPGDRLSFLIVKTNNDSDLLGKKMRLPETYIERSSYELIDYMYYINNLITNPIEQLWSIAYNTELFPLQHKYDYEDKYTFCYKFSQLNEKTYNLVLTLSNTYNGDVYKLYDAILNSDGFKTKANELKSIYITGKKLFHPRLTTKIVKNFVKSIKMNRLHDYVKALVSPSLYQSLLPKLSNL